MEDHDFAWKVTYDGSMTCFDIAHELTDGFGATTFISTMMEYYAKYLDHDLSDIPENTSREGRPKDYMPTPIDPSFPDET